MKNSTKARLTAVATMSIFISGALLILSGCNTSLHAYSVVADSMAPRFRPGDRIFVDESDKARSELHDGDVIALRRDDAVIIKRIMAMPGDTISGEHRKVFRNGKQLEEPYLAPAAGEEIAALATFPSRTVAEGEIFVMGDNRDRSLDSRAEEYAPVRFSDVVGKYSWTYWHGAGASK